MKYRSPDIFLIGYFIVAAIHLISILSGEKLYSVSITKPLLIPFLIGLFYLSTKEMDSLFRRVILLALLLSWIGDAVLLFQDKNANFFLAGLVSFLAAHICYIIAFRQITFHSAKTILGEKPWLVIPFIVYGVLIFLLIKNGLGTMAIPVIIYEVIILMMGITALNRIRRVEFRSFVLAFCGALSFMVSDSLLAINKFAKPFPYSGFLIMVTYLIAQYLIVRGSISQVRGEK